MCGENSKVLGKCVERLGKAWKGLGSNEADQQ
jgi:hypothetical protein